MIEAEPVWRLLAPSRLRSQESFSQCLQQYDQTSASPLAMHVSNPFKTVFHTCTIRHKAGSTGLVLQPTIWTKHQVQTWSGADFCVGIGLHKGVYGQQSCTPAVC